MADYVRAMDDGTERRLEVERATSTEKNGKIHETFLMRVDGQEVGDRTIDIDPAGRTVEFAIMNVRKDAQGQKIGQDTYKAMVRYLERRTREIDAELGNSGKEPWKVKTYPMNPITEHLFKKLFHARLEGIDMVGQLRPLEEIETEERIDKVRQDIETITQRKAA